MCAWVTNYFSNIQLFATHWTADRQSPLSMEISRQEYWCGLLVLPSRVSSDPGMEPASLTSPALAISLFTTSTTWGTSLERMQSVSQSVQSLSHLQLFATPRTTPHQAPFPSPTPESTQTHVYPVGDVIQPSHPPSSPSPPALNLSQHQDLFQLFFWTPKSLQMVIAAMKLKDAYSLEGKWWPT